MLNAALFLILFIGIVNDGGKTGSAGNNILGVISLILIGVSVAMILYMFFKMFKQTQVYKTILNKGMQRVRSLSWNSTDKVIPMEVETINVRASLRRHSDSQVNLRTSTLIVPQLHVNSYLL